MSADLRAVAAGVHNQAPIAQDGVAKYHPGCGGAAAYNGDDRRQAQLGLAS